MSRKVVTSAKAIGEAPAPVEPVTGSADAEVPTEVPAEPTPEPEPVKPPLLRIQVNQIQNIQFGDGSEYKATFGIHDIYDERLATNLNALLNRPHKRQIFALPIP